MALALNSRVTFKSNVNKVLKAIQRANKETQKRVAVLVADRAKRRVPVKSGILRDSIIGKVRKARGEDRYIASISTNTKGKMVLDGEILKKTKKGQKNIGKAAEGAKNIRRPIRYGYGLDVEIGRPSGNYKSTPYLRPALNESIDDIQKILKEETAKEAATK